MISRQDKVTTLLRLKVHPNTNRTLTSGKKIAEVLNLGKWDFIIAGDGSATTWEKSAGYGSILYTKEPPSRYKLFGGFSHGTNNVAEISAVLFPLLWLDANIVTKHWKPIVWCLSDSEYAVNQGSIVLRPGEMRKGANAAMWSAVDHIAQRFQVYFRHVPRMVLPANVYGDTQGNVIRRWMEEVPR
jgi:ribonuclease HI